MAARCLVVECPDPYLAIESGPSRCELPARTTTGQQPQQPARLPAVIPGHGCASVLLYILPYGLMGRPPAMPNGRRLEGQGAVSGLDLTGSFPGAALVIFESGTACVPDSLRPEDLRLIDAGEEVSR
jgi:hypothetical protein